MVDPWNVRLSRIVEAVRHGPGALAADVREAIVDGAVLPEPLATYVVRVAAHPRAAEADVEALLAVGYTQDELFEATVSAALGAGLVRLDAGLAALKEADDAP
jgi:hypothetical protein